MIQTAPRFHESELPDLTYDTPVLVTERLVLRPPHSDDADELAAIANNRQITEMTSRMPFPYRMSDAQEFLARCVDGEHDGYIYAVTLADTGHLIGFTGLELRQRSGGFEIGFWLGEAYWGLGYATEAANAVIDQAFRSTGAEVVHAVCRTVNPASRNVLVKCGFTFIGLDEIDTVSAGRVPVERYTLNRASWFARKER
ncbi:GNAT family N-acetyltransferase [Oricola sp.]|uniref:GNAT family N-acetyltransferase n=1 Tax=Oricola sp. TaxID=1979950 RepID=UPI0025EB2FF7|nr:GNAT family N-acetyltransferase [Oricola sp.]MCI5077662.1 GNAT family N-acetyltransferase [Oricola sp.]